MKKIQILTVLMLVLTVFACKNTGSEAAAPAMDNTSVAAPEAAPAVDTMAAAQDTSMQK
ncbi:MAG TPA: hypothetical protein PKM27_07980 [Saprospiraceae bacterium]|nr:hypothetical protein [Saprospiraceae bacterium]HNT21089.1 hypothetical protein [Saprospiraceae bacterium]